MLLWTEKNYVPKNYGNYILAHNYASFGSYYILLCFTGICVYTLSQVDYK